MKAAIITDLHAGPDVYSRKGIMYKAGHRAPDIARDFVKATNRRQVDISIEAGDRISWDSQSVDIQNMQIIGRIFSKLKAPHYYIPGNNEYRNLNASQISNLTGSPTSSHSVCIKGIRFIFWNTVLNTGKGLSIPRSDLASLKKELSEDTNIPSIICTHIPLDNNSNGHLSLTRDRGASHLRMRYGCHYYNNAHEAREIIENAGNVFMALAGHRHINRLNKINNVLYFTLDSPVNTLKTPLNPGGTYAFLDLDTSKGKARIDIEGVNPRSYAFTF